MRAQPLSFFRQILAASALVVLPAVASASAVLISAGNATRAASEATADYSAASAASAAVLQQGGAHSLEDSGYLVVDIIPRRVWEMLQDPRRALKGGSGPLRVAQPGQPLIAAPSREQPFLRGCVLDAVAKYCAPYEGKTLTDWSPLQIVQYYARRTDIEVTAIAHNEHRGHVTIYFARKAAPAAVK